MAYDYDLFVIGGGSGGVRAARIAALSGARVACAEEYRMGGTCVIRGCVPKKLMVYASSFAKHIKEAAGFGWTIGEVSYNHETLMTALAAEVDRLSGIYTRNLGDAGGDIFDERAELVDAHTVRLTTSGREITAGKILIAVGARPWQPTEEELPGVGYTITSNEVFHLEKLPKHLVIVGGGYIAVEFAHIFAGLGSEVCLVYRGPEVLRGFDDDIRAVVHEGLKEAGVRVITGTVLEKIEETGREGTPLRITLSRGGHIDADVIMTATGRVPNTDGLGCETAGVKLDNKGAVKVDEFSRTNVSNVWAVGDVTNRMQLTPVAIREGQAFADTEFNSNPWSFDHDTVPTAVFTQPEVGTVGLTEDEARHRHGKVDIYKSHFRPMKHTISGDPGRVLMKLIVRAEDDVVLGCHIVGDDAAEMVQTLAIAIKMGATKAQFDQTCALHPSASEELVTMREKFVSDASGAEN